MPYKGVIKKNKIVAERCSRTQPCQRSANASINLCARNDLHKGQVGG